MKIIIIDSERQKTYAKNLIDEMPIDASFEVITKKVDKSSSTKQRGLKWIWNDEIAKSGLGGNDTSKTVHLWNKKSFGHPILMRDSQYYADMFTVIRDAYQQLDDYVDRMKWFVDEHIKTEKFSMKQQAEYLTNVQQYWSRRGVNLCDPDDFGKNLLKYRK